MAAGGAAAAGASAAVACGDSCCCRKCFSSGRPNGVDAMSKSLSASSLSSSSSFPSSSSPLVTRLLRSSSFFRPCSPRVSWRGSDCGLDGAAEGAADIWWAVGGTAGAEDVEG